MPVLTPAVALIPALVFGAGLLSSAPDEPKPIDPNNIVITVEWNGAPGAAPGVAAGVKDPANADAPIKVDPALYAAADWPAHNPDLYAEDFQGKKLAAPLGKETWLTPKQNLDGKVLLLDFWATWCGPCIAATPRLADLQKAHPQGLAVVGVSGQGEDAETIRSYLAEHKPSFAYIHDDAQTVFKPFKSRGIPLVVVVSTDGVVRWMGNPFSETFKPAVEQIVKADPLVKARAVAQD
jgi:thiol-disulfide isomerase/thioredoxin